MTPVDLSDCDHPMESPKNEFETNLQSLNLSPPVLYSSVDFDAVNREIAAGYISEQKHPHAPYRILNYTQRAQFDWRWNPATMVCRGLIVNDLNQVIARPFPKFFSYDQLAGVVPREPFQAFEKMDGSLGILYHVHGQRHIASRGSFTGEQALRATEILHRKYQSIVLDERMTYLFEIIYPENRIVIDYGDTEDLILLAVIDTATGIEQPLPEIGFPCVKQYHGIDDFEALLSQQELNREGFVVRFDSGQRVKIKFDEYKRLHKLLTGINERSIWDALRHSDNLDQILDRVPDEYYNWVRAAETSLRKQFVEIEAKLKSQFAAAPVFQTRKEAAEYFLQREHPSIMFAMLDCKPFAGQIWRMIQPSNELPSFRCNDEG